MKFELCNSYEELKSIISHLRGLDYCNEKNRDTEIRINWKLRRDVIDSGVGVKSSEAYFGPIFFGHRISLKKVMQCIGSKLSEK